MTNSIRHEFLYLGFIALIASAQASCTTTYGVIAQAGPTVGFVPGEGVTYGWSGGFTPSVVPLLVPLTLGQTFRPRETITFMDIGLSGFLPLSPYTIPFVGVAAGTSWSNRDSKAGLDFNVWAGDTVFLPGGISFGRCNSSGFDWGVSLSIGVRFLQTWAPEIYLTPQIGIGVSGQSPACDTGPGNILGG